MSMFPKKAFDRETPDEQRLLEDLGWETLTDKERHQLLERLAAQASPRELPPKREQPSSSNSTRREPKSKKLKHEILSIDPVFLGEMVVTGYATTSVVGNVALSLHRHAQSSTGPRSSSKQGKSTKKNPFGRSGSSAAVKSPKGNTIVRLRDRKGRDIGKLEAATSTFIAKLLDWEWV